MCDGGLDPKYQMREIEARVKTVTIGRTTYKQPTPVRTPGLLAVARGVVAWLWRKGAANV